MTDWTSAVRPTLDGVRLDLEVTPGAKSSAFAPSFNAWRKRIEVRVRAPPEDGRANDEVLALAAAFFGLAASRVRLASGARSRQKSIELDGMSAAQVIERLERSA